MNPSKPQSSFVLHAKPYKETSLWLEIFTKESGRVAAIAKGAKRPKSPVRGLLQSFTPLLVTLVGQHDLLTVTSAEMMGAPLRLASKELMAGFYCNELIIKLLHRHDPHPQLFRSYEETVHALSRGEALEETLRRFEFKLIDEIGYGLELLNDADTLETIDPAGSYQWIARHGFVQRDVG
jgi:DNA repair protein RecO (recombination protein O)